MTTMPSCSTESTVPAGQNRLALEQSPYLLQHADNPVDWYPWGPEAFERARLEHKPIFLSIGYATCHWCHVMEHESFEDPEVAALMNDTFICIKVDREERPDIDQVYMAVCQMMTGGGGWPLTVLLTPDQQPFFAGTYFPKTGRFGRPGMMELIPEVKRMWAEQQDELLTSANKITEALRNAKSDMPMQILSESTLQTAFDRIYERYDARNGGFGAAPKFPTPHQLTYLLRFWKRTGETKALQVVEHTLTAMRLGGMYDHLGFGFHRYSTDERWLVPHFEKMLYDQALLAIAYTETWQATGKAFYRETAEEIFTYVLRDMTAPEGGFYSAEDADSDGVEGLFYLWSQEEVERVLQDLPVEVVQNYWNVRANGNFEPEAPGQPEHTNILHMSATADDIAKQLNMPVDLLEQQIANARQQLLTVREERIHPLKDDKILCDWNGLMIAALAIAGRAFDNAEYLAAADKSADFILQNMCTPEGRLLHRHRNGESKYTATLEDYAFFVWGLTELYQSTFATARLQQALQLNADMVKWYRNDDEGGFYMTADDGETLLVRSQDVYDGAIPSGNSVAALNLLRLGRITARPELEEEANLLLQKFAGELTAIPPGHTQMLQALDFGIGPTQEVVITGATDSESTQAMLRGLQALYLPGMVAVFRATDGDDAISKLAPYAADKTSALDKATAYVCRNYMCALPTTDIVAMQAMLQEK
jgi:uncharacterized protein